MSRRSEDFDFLVTCAAKGNMAMYDLLRDRSLDPPKPKPKPRIKRRLYGWVAIAPDTFTGYGNTPAAAYSSWKHSLTSNA